MKAVTYAKYGSPDVLEIKELSKPVPKNNEVLIKTIATTVTSGDRRVRSLDVPFGFGLISRLVFGISGPKQPILGTELAGTIEAVGKDVTKFNIGDSVFAFNGVTMGCHAEYKCIPEDGSISLKPENLTFDEAAALSFGGTSALDFFRRGNLRSGDKVLINGASGSVGTAAVQLAKHFGAEVTGVCSTPNVELVKTLGAAYVIDYTKEDFTQNGETYDIIVDTVGTAQYNTSKDSLKDDGRLLLVFGELPDMLRIPWVLLTSSKKIIAGPANANGNDLRFLAKLAEAGEYKPVIDRRYPLEEISEAHRYVDAGHKKGNVIVNLNAE